MAKPIEYGMQSLYGWTDGWMNEWMDGSDGGNGGGFHSHWYLIRAKHCTYFNALVRRKMKIMLFASLFIALLPRSPIAMALRACVRVRCVCGLYKLRFVNMWSVSGCVFEFIGGSLIIGMLTPQRQQQKRTMCKRANTTWYLQKTTKHTKRTRNKHLPKDQPNVQYAHACSNT